MKLSAGAAIQIIYFMPSVLAFSSCGGTRRYPALNCDIIGACFSKLIIILLELIILYVPY